MTTIGAGFRLMRAGWIMVREGVIAALPGDQFPALPKFGWRVAKLLARPRSRRRGRSERLADAVARLGPSYVKLGQFLATRPDVVGNDIAVDLAMLQDKMETFPKEQAVALIEASLGRPIGELFTSLGEPVAAASIAQVHPAEVLRDGIPVKMAVKVIRPGVRRRFHQDLQSYFLAARLQERYFPSTRRLRPVEVTETLAQTTRIEMDFRLEAAAISILAENIAADPGFRVPVVDWERTGGDVLTMEWIDGIKMSDVEALRDAGHDLKAIAANLVQSFLRHTLRDGFFHADMHPGNLFVETDGTIVAVDLGISGRLGRKERRFLAEILYGFITRNYHRVAEVHFEAGYVPPKHDVVGLRPGDPRYRRTHPWPARRNDLDGAALDAAVRGHGTLRHADPHRTGAAAEDHGRRRRRRPHARSRPSTCGRPRSRWSANGSPAISARAACCPTRVRASARSVACPPSARPRRARRAPVA